MSTLKKLGFGLIALSGLLLFVYIRGCQSGYTPPVSPGVLKPDEKEQILIDPTHHTITVVTPNGVTRKTLPDNPSTVIIKKGGDVVVKSPQFGYQQKPFIGVGFSNKWRFIAGCDLFYFKHLDLGPGLSFEPNQPFDTMRVNAVLSYNIWSNTRVGVAIDHLGKFAGFVTVRL